MFTLGPREFIVGLGSSDDLGVAMLRRARSVLRAHPSLRLVATSPLYESDALLPPDGPRHWARTYFNAACLMEWVSARPFDAGDIVAAFKDIERTLGRVAAERWAPRPIDLDLLAWGGPAVNTEAVTVPHRGLYERPFALLPAQDCAGPTRCNPHHPWRYAPTDLVPLRTRLSQQTFAELVAVLNVTPDSFSDGSPALNAHVIERRVRAAIAAGATVIDVGAESTRPGATAVTPDAERERLAPALDVLSRLKNQIPFRISLDTRHGETAAWALEKFLVDWINDVGGTDSKLIEAVVRSSASLVLMHSLTVPPRRDVIIDPGKDPVAEVLAWGKARIAALCGQGLPQDRILFDPGIGFGKTPSQNLALIRRASEFSALGVPLFMGHSRKGFLDLAGTVPAAQRDLETAILTASMANASVDFIRVHDIETQERALRLGCRLT